MADLWPSIVCTTLTFALGHDRERRRGVAQHMRRKAVQPHRLDGGVETLAPEVAQVQYAALLGGEHEVVGAFACDVGGQLVDEEARHGHGAPLMILRAVEHGATVDIGDRLSVQMTSA